MPAERMFAENDPLHHTTKLKRMLAEIIEHAREDMSKISDEKAKRLLEKTADTLSGLKREYESYEKEDASGMKKAS